MKLAIIITSDPKSGEEALGRAFNALALAADADRRGEEVEVVFAGTGTRWPKELTRLDHPAHALYESVRGVVAGASLACAVVFGAKDSVREAGLPELRDNELAGTPGLAGIHRYLAGGWQTLVF